MDTGEMLEACEEQAELDDATRGPSTPRKPTFNKWEHDFLESIREQYEERGFLTEKQEEILERLYERC
jgi:hypothetical protein